MLTAKWYSNKNDISFSTSINACFLFATTTIFVGLVTYFPHSNYTQPNIFRTIRSFSHNFCHNQQSTLIIVAISVSNCFFVSVLLLFLDHLFFHCIWTSIVVASFRWTIIKCCAAKKFFCLICNFLAHYLQCFFYSTYVFSLSLHTCGISCRHMPLLLPNNGMTQFFMLPKLDYVHRNA